MKYANKVNLLFFVITVFALIFLVKVRLDSFESERENGTGVDARGKELVVDVNASWPMFHNEPGLRGYVSEGLPGELGFAWKFKTDDEVKSSPVIDGGVVFVGSVDANVYAIDLRDGRVKWSYTAGDAIEGTPCVLGGQVFVGCSDSFLYALDAKTGTLKWKYETGGEILGSANWLPGEDGQETRIVFGSYDSKLHCVNAAGEFLWAYETDSYVNSTPAIEDGKIAFGGCDGMIHVVSAADGNGIVQIDAKAYIAGASAISDGQVYVGNYENSFFRADINSGEIVWEYLGSDQPYFSSPAIAGDSVVFGGRDNKVHCLNIESGEEKWSFDTLGEVNSSPAICVDKVVVGCDDGRLYVLNLSDGKEFWSYEIGQAVSSSPAVAGGVIVVGCDDGYVYAFGAKR